VCVFCGSNEGNDARYLEAARSLGLTLAEREIDLVYGGAGVGLMAALADATLAAGGHVTGVIPTRLVERELAHARLTDLRVVASMHERKALMADLADAFIALPGGIGTLDETFEILTWAQLGLHQKPCGLLDVAGYYQPLLVFLDHAVTARFVTPEHRAMILVDDVAGRMLDRLQAFTPPRGGKWFDRDTV
jgi:uncharacterized protein (TIGR00730 family)